MPSCMDRVEIARAAPKQSRASVAPASRLLGRARRASRWLPHAAAALVLAAILEPDVCLAHQVDTVRERQRNLEVVFHRKAGFKHCRRAAETPFNLIFEMRR